MKTKIQTLLAALMTFSAFHHATGQGTAFSYEGQLHNNGSLASGTYDFTFSLYNAASGGTVIAGPVTTNGVVVANGLFQVTLDFGASVWDGATNWLQIGAETSGSTTFTYLAPLQQITPVPQAIFATTASNLLGTLAVGQLSGTVSLKQLPSTVVTQNESGLTLNDLNVTGNLNLPAPAIIYSGSSTAFYANGDNVYAGLGAGVISPAELDNTAIGADAMGSATSDSGAVAIGYAALQADIAGTSTKLPNGQTYITSGQNIAVGFEALQQNTVGTGNTAVGYRTLTDNVNGYQNTAVGQAALLVNTTGFYNTASGSGALSSEGGGIANVAVGADSFQNLGNGNQNAAVGAFSFQKLSSGSANIGLGYNAGQNLTSGNNNIYIGYRGNSSESSMIYLGDPNVQTDTYLAGNLHAPGGMILDSAGADTGALSAAWSLTFGGAPPYAGEGIGSVRVSGQNDSYGLDFYTDFAKRLVIQNGGNVGIGTANPSSLLTVAGQISCQSITVTSDRNAKEDFASVDPRSVLEKVSTLPVTQWRYKQDTNGVNHIGPMAQDFQAAFGLNGADSTHISVVDEGGVALAAIQGLNQKLEAENAALKRQNDALAKQLNDLARAVRSLAEEK